MTTAVKFAAYARPFATRDVEPSTQNVALGLSAGATTTYAACEEGCRGSATCNVCNTGDGRKIPQGDFGRSDGPKSGCRCVAAPGTDNGTPIADSTDVKGWT